MINARLDWSKVCLFAFTTLPTIQSLRRHFPSGPGELLGACLRGAATARIETLHFASIFRILAMLPHRALMLKKPSQCLRRSHARRAPAFLLLQKVWRLQG